MQLDALKQSADEINFEKMKATYQACLDEATIKSLGIKPLTELLDQIKGSLAFQGSGGRVSTKDTDAIKSTILLLAKQGISALIASGTGADDRNPDTVVVSVSAPRRIGLPSKERYEDEKLVQQYQDVLIEVLSAIYPEANKDSFAHVVELEKKLAAASPSTQEREDVTVCDYSNAAIDLI
jgi:endothelin-converting enzyme